MIGSGWALDILFIVAFLWLVCQTDWVKNRLKRTSLRCPTALSFPKGGLSLVPAERREGWTKQKGYAKIAIRNHGALLKNCVVKLTGVSYVNLIDGDVKGVQPLALKTPQQRLHWDFEEDGQAQTKIDIPNDGLPYLARVAYLDQDHADVWRIASSVGLQDPDFSFPPSWYKLDLVVSSESEKPNPLRVSVLLGLGVREGIPPPITCWEWESWTKRRVFPKKVLEELKRVAHEKDEPEEKPNQSSQG